jgi:hypothetical protein
LEAKAQPGLGSQTGDQLFAGDSERLSGETVTVSAPRSSSSCLTRNERLPGGASANAWSTPRPSSVIGCGIVPLCGQVACGCSSSPTSSHTVAWTVPVASHDEAGHVDQGVIGGGAGDGLRELREHLVRGGSLAVDQPIRQPPAALASWLERDGDQRGGDDRQEQLRLPARADQHADPTTTAR